MTDAINIDARAGAIFLSDADGDAKAVMLEALRVDLIQRNGLSGDAAYVAARQGVKQAAARQNQLVYALKLVHDRGADLDALLSVVKDKLADFQDCVAAARSLAQVDGLGADLLDLSEWAGVVHERLLTDLGGFSAHLRNSGNTPTGGDTRLGSWAPSYEAVRHG